MVRRQSRADYAAAVGAFTERSAPIEPTINGLVVRPCPCKDPECYWSADLRVMALDLSPGKILRCGSARIVTVEKP
jgi:hypothetical protein